MDLRVVLDHPFIVLGLLVAVIVGKLLAARAMVAAGALQVGGSGGVALAQVGEFSFILAQQGRTLASLPEISISCFWQCRSRWS